MVTISDRNSNTNAVVTQAQRRSQDSASVYKTTTNDLERIVIDALSLSLKTEKEKGIDLVNKSLPS